MKKSIDEALKMLQDGVHEILQSDNYRRYLLVMSRFHHYSTNNCILIAMQRPDATCVAGYSTWKSLGRTVKHGEHGIRILAPCPVRKHKDEDGAVVTVEKDAEEVTMMLFKAVSVFDYSQTEGKPLPSFGPDELAGECAQYDELLNAITQTCPVPVRFADIPGGAKGYYHLTDREIVIQSGMGASQTIKTALHETAHSILHSEKGTVKDRHQEETEAESVAFVVCTHFGIDTSDYSFPYLAGWSSSADGKEILDSLDTIRRTAGSLISDLELVLQEDSHEGRAS